MSRTIHGFVLNCWANGCGVILPTTIVHIFGARKTFLCSLNPKFSIKTEVLGGGGGTVAVAVAETEADRPPPPPVLPS